MLKETLVALRKRIRGGESYASLEPDFARHLIMRGDNRAYPIDPTFSMVIRGTDLTVMKAIDFTHDPVPIDYHLMRNPIVGTS
ncbi:MAG TPA: hypothetical protein VJB12_04580 [Candidatus Nanoarchaeia archaeon]|nr:hypothetical protein [Candidatus Nanoarchaeia archaeon]